jgi:hypothetical protein
MCRIVGRGWTLGIFRMHSAAFFLPLLAGKGNCGHLDVWILGPRTGMVKSQLHEEGLNVYKDLLCFGIHFVYRHYSSTSVQRMSTFHNPLNPSSSAVNPPTPINTPAALLLL